MLKIWKMKVFRIRQSIAHFDQWKPLISKNVIQNKMHWLDFEAAEVQRSFSRSPRPKFQNHLVFMTFHNRIFVVFVFDKISKGMLVTIEKEVGEYFQRLYFWNQWVPLIKLHCRLRYLLDFDLKIQLKSAQARC